MLTNERRRLLAYHGRPEASDHGRGQIGVWIALLKRNMVLQFFAAGANAIFLTEERYAPFGQPLLVLADAVVRAEVCLLSDRDVQPHGGLVRVVRLLRHGIPARLVLDVFPVVPLPIVDPHGVRLDCALHRGRGAVVAAQHLPVDADKGGNCKCRV